MESKITEEGIHVDTSIERIPKGRSKMDNPEKLYTGYGTQDEEKQNNMYWTPLYASKHKQRK
jgi:hypothetical protein